MCTPDYLAQHPEIASLEGVRNSVLLNLSQHGRSQVAEHVDWSVWLAIHRLDLEDRPQHGAYHFNANDYKLLIQMVLGNQDVALGFDYLVRPLIEKAMLTRSVARELELKDTRHYFACRDDKACDSALQCFRAWQLAQTTG